MGMDTRTGEIRELKQGETPNEHEVLLSEKEAKRLLPMKPRQRLDDYAARRNAGKSPRSKLPKSAR